MTPGLGRLRPGDQRAEHRGSDFVRQGQQLPAGGVDFQFRRFAAHQRQRFPQLLPGDLVRPRTGRAAAPGSGTSTPSFFDLPLLRIEQRVLAVAQQRLQLTEQVGDTGGLMETAVGFGGQGVELAHRLDLFGLRNPKTDDMDANRHVAPFLQHVLPRLGRFGRRVELVVDAVGHDHDTLFRARFVEGEIAHGLD